MENIFTPEQLEKLKACRSEEEIAAFAKENGSELSDEELEKISGGDWTDELRGSIMNSVCGTYGQIERYESQGWTHRGQAMPEKAKLGFYFACERCDYKNFCPKGKQWQSELRQRAIEIGWRGASK